MRERPILMSGEMVRAVLSGAKTQTRRLMTPQPVSNGLCYSRELGDILCLCDYLPPSTMMWKRGTKRDPYYSSDVEDDWSTMCPHGVVGDRLWVRETFYCDHFFAGDYEQTLFAGRRRTLDGDRVTQADRVACEAQWRTWTRYRADYSLLEWVSEWEAEIPKLTSSIHMPRWASRLTLELTGVRVERLQDIGEDDAKAEGVELIDGPGHKYVGLAAQQPHKFEFEKLWSSLNAKRAPWSSNPWVWALSFKRVESADGKAASNG